MVNQQPSQIAYSLITTNNDAVVYLKMGELNESYSLLLEAVATLQKTIRDQPPTNITPSRYNFHWNDLTFSNANGVFESSEQSGLPFLFQRFITVDMPRRREIRSNRFCPSGLGSILHYNLALAAHLLGIQKAEFGKSYLQEAKGLYGMVFADVQHSSSRGSRRSSSSSSCCSMMMADHYDTALLIVLQMGIWNNQRCIYMDLGMEEQAANCSNRLRKLLLSTRASSNSLPEWRYFYLNLVTLEKQGCIAAAA